MVWPPCPSTTIIMIGEAVLGEAEKAELLVIHPVNEMQDQVQTRQQLGICHMPSHQAHDGRGHDCRRLQSRKSQDGRDHRSRHCERYSDTTS